MGKVAEFKGDAKVAPPGEFFAEVASFGEDEPAFDFGAGLVELALREPDATGEDLFNVDDLDAGVDHNSLGRLTNDLTEGLKAVFVVAEALVRLDLLLLALGAALEGVAVDGVILGAEPAALDPAFAVAVFDEECFGSFAYNADFDSFALGCCVFHFLFAGFFELARLG